MDHQELVERLAAVETELSRLREERIPAVDRSSRRRDRRLTLAYVLVTAVVVGLTAVGSASALDGTNTVFSDDIVDGTVTSLDLKNNSVITSDIKDESVASRDIQNGSIGSADVADDAITSADITDGSVNGLDVAYESLTGEDVSNGSLNGSDLNLFNDNECTGETVQGTALINADPAVPYTATNQWVGYPHNCTGQPVTVRRQGVGQYIVQFEGSPARLAVATSTTIGTMVSIANYDPGEFFIVSLRRSDGALVDDDFTVLAY